MRARLSEWRPTRRQVLRAALVAAAAGEIIYLAPMLGGFSPVDLARWRLRALALRLGGEKSVVALVRAPSYSSAREALDRGWALLNGAAGDFRGRSVVLKVNLVDAVPGHPAHTDPQLVEAAINFFRDHGAREVIVADGSAFQTEPALALVRSGLRAVLDRTRSRFVDLNHDDLELVSLKGGYSRLHSLWLPRTVTRAEYLVSMPKLKCHHWTGVSLSLKNLFGTVPGSRYGWPKNELHFTGIELNILGLYDTLRPALALVDGIVGMEGDGPIFGSPRATGVLLMGADGVAVDSTAVRVMGLDPGISKHLSSAGAWGLGRYDEGDVEVRGEMVTAVRDHYALPPAISGGL